MKRWAVVSMVGVAAIACTVRDAPVDLGCDDPVPIVQPGTDSPSGFVACGDGFVHRQDAPTCVIPPAPATCTNDGVGTDTCATSAECTERPHGACLVGGSVFDGCTCVYGCESDAECGDGEVCACTGVVDWPRCVPAGCRTDADCEGLCGLSQASDGCGGVRTELACLDDGSQCRSSCPQERGCYGNLGVPACEVVTGEWICNVDDLCEDCG